MTKLKVQDMHCEHCGVRVSRALDEQGIRYQVQLADRTVSIEGSEAEVLKAVEALDDIGYEALREQ